jgi:tRNA pseudouridine55 synthase
VLDKPLGLGSTPALARVRRLFDAAKGGHAGTLDPLATGVLPIALGEATKTLAYVLDTDKEYVFTVRWGAATTTDDREGELVATSDARPTRAAIEAALGRFVGEIMQAPPAFSAIKIDGERAYDLARAGAAPEMARRLVRVHGLVLEDVPDPDHAILRVACGKGTYVRSLARDLGAALGTFGHVAALRRTKAGPFTEKQARSLDEIAISLASGDGLVDSPALSGPLLPVETALADIPALAVTEAEAALLRQGQAIRPTGIVPHPGCETVKSHVVQIHADDRLVALARLEGGRVWPVRVLNP